MSYYYDDATGSSYFSMATDDWVCEDDRPITDLHWWGSYIGWTQPTPPPQVPDYFKICIWKDVPQNVPGPAGMVTPYSRPAELVWEHDCYKWVWNFAGYDLDPRWGFSNLPEYDWQRLGEPQENESCFQFNQLLSQDEWFRQETMIDGVPNIYWLSIAAVYLNTTPEQVQYPWGWKTRPYDPTVAPDVAGVIQDVSGDATLKVGSTIVNAFFPLCLPNPDFYPDGLMYDLAFELTTNEPGYEDNPIPGDIAGPGVVIGPDGTVDLNDLALMAGNWLMVAP